MKKKKFILSILSLAGLLPMASCSKGNISSTVSSTSAAESNIDSSTTKGDDESISPDETTSLDHQFLYTDFGTPRLTTEPETSMVDTIIETLISKGGSLITGGIQTYAKAVVLNLLKECGYDFRDATTKTLDKIQEQISAIEEKITTLSKMEDQHHSEDILNQVLKQLTSAENSYMDFAVTGIGDVADTENNESLTEDEKEAARLSFYNNSVKKLTINGSPLCSFVSDLCDAILTPNQADPGKDIFYYYQQTLGAYDAWSTLKTKNMKNFMAYLASTVVALTNLSKFQIYYMTKGKDSATVKSYENMINKTVAKANLVNEKLKNALEGLKEYEEKEEAGINVYLSTGKEYSLRMATLTYSHAGDSENDSRRALMVDCQGGVKTNRIYYYQPNEDIVKSVVSDFKAYTGNFFATSYTLQDYLTYAGFYAKNEDLFKKAAGLYNGNLDVNSHGWLYDDHDYSINYYDTRCDYVRKTVYEVDSYHYWTTEIKRTTIKLLDDNEYLCFATPDGEKQKLDGKYSYTDNKDNFYTINKDQYYNFNSWEEIYQNDVNGWYLHDCW